MASTTQFHHDRDPLWQLYARVLRKSAPSVLRQASLRQATLRQALNPSRIPSLTGRRHGVESDPARVTRYAEICGFESVLTYPSTWPHVLAFPLHLELLSDPDFPLSLLGLVHLRNRIVQQRRIHVGEYLDIQCEVANPAVGHRGLTFDLRTQASSSGQRVWEETSTFLFRHPSSGTSAPKKPSPEREPLPRYAKTRTLVAPESIGRRYGRVSGDFNPIHLHALSARAFGFPRAIAHGMWSKARCLAALQQQPEWRDGPVEIEVDFKKPLFLPGKATLNWQSRDGHLDFQLLDAKALAPHLSGSVRWQA